MPYTTAPQESATKRRLLQIGIPAAVLAIGLLLAVWMLRTGPQAKQRPRPRTAPLVEVRPLASVNRQALLHAMGTVTASRLVELRPQVGGRVLEMADAFLPGGHLAAGAELLRIDPDDYRLTVDQLGGEVAKAEAELRLEEGNQLVAQKEYELFGSEVSEAERALMLRQPQLDSLRAALVAAEARLAKARLDLERTGVHAPFNAVVVSREVNLGAYVSTATPLGQLAGTDSYWIEAAVPASQLRWIQVPGAGRGEGSRVRVFDESAWGGGRFREGRVLRVAADLEEQGRMARLLVEVPDPLALKKGNRNLPVLLLGAYVRVEIDGEALAGVVPVARTELRDGDTAWVMSSDKKLEIRPLQVAFRGRDEVLVSEGLEDGELLVTSSLSTPVAGMELRRVGDEAAEPTQGGGTPP